MIIGLNLLFGVCLIVWLAVECFVDCFELVVCCFCFVFIVGCV